MTGWSTDLVRQLDDWTQIIALRISVLPGQQGSLKIDFLCGDSGLPENVPRDLGSSGKVSYD